MASRHRADAYAVSYRILRNADDAEEITQEALLRAFRAWHQFRGDCDPGVWLARIARNLALNHVSRRREFAGQIEDAPDEMDVCSTVERSVLADTIVQEIDRLPPALGMPLRLSDYEGLRSDQIAQRLRISPEAVRARLSRGRRMLCTTMRPWS